MTVHTLLPLLLLVLLFVVAVDTVHQILHDTPLKLEHCGNFDKITIMKVFFILSLIIAGCIAPPWEALSW